MPHSFKLLYMDQILGFRRLFNVPFIMTTSWIIFLPQHFYGFLFSALVFQQRMIFMPSVPDLHLISRVCVNSVKSGLISSQIMLKTLCWKSLSWHVFIPFCTVLSQDAASACCGLKGGEWLDLCCKNNLEKVCSQL